MCSVCIFIRIYLYPGLLYGRGQLYWDAHPSAAAVSSLGFSNHIIIPSLFFSFKKLLKLIISFFESDDIAFLFGLLTASAAAVSSLGFSNHIIIPSLFFSFKKLLKLIISFFESDDIAFLFGLLTACDTRCHWYSPLYMFSGGSVTRLRDQLTCSS